MSEALNEGSDYLESQDIDERIEELTMLAQDDAITCDEEEELEQLCSVRDEFGSIDWQFGIELIHESAFTEHAKEFAYGVGLIDGDTEGWPFTHIDWDEAAEELKQDYTTVTLGDHTYYGKG